MVTNAVYMAHMVSAPSRNGFRKEGANGLAGAEAVPARPHQNLRHPGRHECGSHRRHRDDGADGWLVEAKQRAAVERQRDAAQADAPRAIGAQRITPAHESIPDGWLNALRLFPQGLYMTSPR